MAGFKADGVDEELLLDRGQGVVEEARLRPVIREAVGDFADQVAIVGATRRGEEAVALSLVGLLGEALVESVRGV